jgi:RNA polymerase sigma-70 factor (ECF subfamily)
MEPADRKMKFRQSEQFVVLWTAAQPAITAYIRTVVPDFQQAEEVLQRVAVRMVRKFDAYEPSRSFAAWAIGFAKKEVLYYRRQRATDKHRFSDAIVEQLSVTFQQLIEDVDPMREALANCVQQLEGKSKLVIELRYGRNMNSAAIAGKMDLSSGAVRMLLWRVRQALKECIEKRMHGVNPEATG